MSTIRDENSHRPQTSDLDSSHEAQGSADSSTVQQGRKWNRLSSNTTSQKVEPATQAALALIAEYFDIHPHEVHHQIDDLMDTIGLKASDLSAESTSLQESELEKKIQLLSTTIARQLSVTAYTGISRELAVEVDLYVRDLLKTNESGITRVVFGKTDHSIELTIDAKRRVVIFKTGFDEIITISANKTAVAAKEYFSGEFLAILKPHANVNRRPRQDNDLPSPTAAAAAAAGGVSFADSPLLQPSTLLDRYKPMVVPHSDEFASSFVVSQSSFDTRPAERSPSSSPVLGGELNLRAPPLPESPPPPDRYGPMLAQYVEESSSSSVNSESSLDTKAARGLPPPPLILGVEMNLRSATSSVADTPVNRYASYKKAPSFHFTFSEPDRYKPYSPAPPLTSIDEKLLDHLQTKKPLNNQPPVRQEQAAREHRLLRELDFTQLFAGIPGLANSILIDRDSSEMYQERMSDLNSLLRDPLDNRKQLLTAMLGCVTGLRYLHDHNYIHRDIKPENILCTESKAMLSDLESVCSLDELEELAQSWSTIDYMSPEMISENRPSKASDIWAVGMILYQMTGKPLESHPAFNGKFKRSPADLMEQLGSLSTTDRARYEEDYLEPPRSSLLEHLAWQCTRVDPGERPNVHDVHQILHRLLTSS